MAVSVTDARVKGRKVELLRSGDAAAWEDVVNEYQAPLSRYLHRMVQDRELARDLTQDTFLEAYQAAQKSEGRLELKPWLYRIATNNAIQVLRRRRLISWLPWVDGVVSREAPSRPSQEDCFIQGELVRQALDGLPAKYRSVLLLHENDGFNCEQIGGIVNISQQAAKKRLARARVMFRDAYDKLDVAR